MPTHPKTLFVSKKHPGVVLNRYGIALRGASICREATRAAVVAEALAAGWRRVYGPEAADVGMTIVPPEIK